MSLTGLSELLCLSCKFFSKPCSTVTGQKLASSPVPHILGSCHALTQQEANTVDDFIDALDEQIADLDAQLEHISKIRDTLSLNRAAHHNLLSPIRRIPDELLIEVFRLYLSMSGMDVRQLVLFHVCSRWRNIVLSSNISVWSLMDTGELPGPLIDVWIARSGNSPLMVTLWSVRALRPNILQQSYRLRGIEASEVTLTCLFLESENELPMLRILYCREFYGQLFEFSNFPFAQITHLAAAGVADLQRVLAHFPNLISLDIEHELDLVMTPEALVHPRLQYLKLRPRKPSYQSTTPQKFDFPSLKSLNIVVKGFTCPCTPVIQHIVASSHSLDALVLHNAYPEDYKDFVKLLEQLPDLRKLHCRGDNQVRQEETMNPNFCLLVRHIITELSSRPSLLPKLKILSLEFSRVKRRFPLLGIHDDMTDAVSNLMSERSLVEENGPFHWLKDLGCPGDGAFR